MNSQLCCFNLGKTYQVGIDLIVKLREQFESVFLLDLAEKARTLENDLQELKFPDPFEPRDLTVFAEALHQLTIRTNELMSEGKNSYLEEFEVQTRKKFLLD